MNLVFVRALSGAIAVASVTIASALPTISFPSNALTTLFTNNGHGGFVRTGGSIGANMLNPLGATWGDFDNNGALDLFIANNNGDGTFTRVNVGPMTSDVTRSFTQAWADINNDGFPDVLITGVYTPRSLQGNDGNNGRQQRSSHPAGRDKIQQRIERHRIAVAAGGANHLSGVRSRGDTASWKAIFAGELQRHA